MSLTFGDLQSKVLGWLDETDDSSVVLANVKEAINAANARRAGSYEWPFMLSSATGTLTPGVSEYNLATDINTLLSIYNQTQELHYRQVPYRHYTQGETVTDGFVFDGSTVTFLSPPTAADTIIYYYYRQPVEMTVDGDIPDIPYPYSRVLIYDALLDLSLYSEDVNAAKVARWERMQLEIETDLLASRLDGNSLKSNIQRVREFDEDHLNGY